MKGIYYNKGKMLASLMDMNNFEIPNLRTKHENVFGKLLTQVI